jgi:hypothetical protein
MTEKHRKEDGGLTDRLLAAFLAPIVFNLSNLILIAVLFRRARGFGRFLFYDVPMLGSFLLWGLLIIPALIGFLVGMDRLISLIGHLFYTHTESQRNQAITFAAWAGLLLAAFLLSRAF